jgi:aldehyde dehydrogenase (NAD+)
MTIADFTPTAVATIPAIVQRARDAFDSGRTRPLSWRRAQLDGMRKLLEDNSEQLLAALAADLGKPAAEGWVTDIGFTIGEIKLLQKNLRKWTRPEHVSTPIVALPGSSHRVAEPLGVVAIISPWNYPIQLLLSPAAGAIAAGNSVVLKPSEIAPHTSTVITELIQRYLDPDAVQVIEGGVAETTELLAQRFDHIFYTGNGRIGRVVMEAAAKHLTPVTLELGGKSPTIVDATANLRVAARRIAWGKFLNAGQTCIAPDYLLVDKKVAPAFIGELRAAIKEFYGDDPKQSGDYARIVNGHHFNRLASMLESGSVVIGGETDANTKYIAPTVLADVNVSAPVMQDEIFGPILPMVEIDNVAEAIAFINSKPHPLALYVFSEDDRAIDAVIERTTAGGVTVNGTILHISNPNLPFGGVGESGMGAYHGKSSIDIFQHRKPVLRKSTKVDPSIAYPPYTEKKMKLIRKAV